MDYILLLSTLFIVTFLVGNYIFFISKINLKEPSIRVSIKLFTGIITLVCLYSIAVSKFITINILLFFFMIFIFRMIYLKTKEDVKHYDYKDEIKLLLKIYIALLFCLCVQFFLTNYFSKQYFQFTFFDFTFYSMVSGNLNSKGLESIYNFYKNYNISKSITPYHYFELWLTAFFSYTTKKPVYLSYVFFTIPFLFSLIVSSLLSFLSAFKPRHNSNYNLIIIILLMFVTLTYAPFYYGGGPHSTNIFYYQKHWSAFVVLPYSYFFYNSDKKIIAYSLLFLLPIFNIVYAPIVFLLLLFFFFFEKSTIKLFIIVNGIIFCFVFFFFYFLLGNYENVLFAREKFSLASYFKGFSIRMYELTKIQALFLLPFYTFLYYLYRNKIFSLNINSTFILFFLPAGILCSSFFNHTIEAYQFWEISVLPVSYLLILMAYAYSTMNKFFGKIFLLLATPLFLSSIYFSMYEKKYFGGKIGKPFIDDVRGHFLTLKKFNAVGGFSRSNYMYTSNYESPNYLKTTNVISLLCSDFSITTIDLPDDVSTNYTYNQHYQQSPIKLYYNKYGKGITIKNIQRAFINETKLEFIILEDYKIDYSHYSDLVDKVFIDSVSGSAILFLK